MKKVKLFLSVLTGIAIIGVTGGTANYLLSNKSKTERVTPAKIIPAVTTVQLKRGSLDTIISGMASVSPAQTVSLISEVSGLVNTVSLDLTPGNFIEKGALAVKLNKQDLTVVVSQRRNEVAQKTLNLTLEKGRGETAAQELKLLGEELSGLSLDLVLRTPHKAAAQADLKAAKANLDLALLNVRRTTLNSPINGIITSRHIELGSWVNRGTTIVATIVGSDTAWIELSLPLDELAAIDVGSEPHVTLRHDSWGEGLSREGIIKHRMPTLDKGSQMGRVLIEVSDPFSLNKKTLGPALLMDSLVTVTVEGEHFDNIYKVAKDDVHDGSIYMLVNSTLDIEPVDIVYDDASSIYFYSDKQDVRLITSNLPFPVEGMTLTTEAK